MSLKQKSRTDGKKFLQDAFAAEQKHLLAALQLSSKSITHDGEMGEVNENLIINMLRKYLPNRYKVDSGVVVDSCGRTSDQIDVIIYDRQYTPTLLDQENFRFVPAEAVYCVFEVKPEVSKRYYKYAVDKVNSVRGLDRTSVEIPYADGKYGPKPLFKIVSGIISVRMGWEEGFEGKPFKNISNSYGEEERLDCGLSISGHCFDYHDGKILTCPSEQALIFFLFRLLKKLQSLATVPAIDWDAYADTLGQSM
ncbi:MAG: hypothetical protein HQL52_04050 [Magnetococcales bacterium]|nr:hypothetical protein [Magnetococcales bacterium]